MEESEDAYEIARVLEARLARGSEPGPARTWNRDRHPRARDRLDLLQVVNELAMNVPTRRRRVDGRRATLPRPQRRGWRTRCFPAGAMQIIDTLRVDGDRAVGGA